MALTEGEVGTMGLGGGHHGLEGGHLLQPGPGLDSGAGVALGKAGGPRGADACPFAPTELKATGTAHFFNFLLNSSDYRILLKDEDHDRMYVGSKDYVLSLDLHDINREPLIVSCHRRARVEGGHLGGRFRCRGKSSMGIAGTGGEEVGPDGNPDLLWAGVSADPLARVPAEDRGVHPVGQEQQRECGHQEPPSGSNGGVSQHRKGIRVLVSYLGKAIPQVPCSSAASAAMLGWRGTPR